MYCIFFVRLEQRGRTVKKMNVLEKILEEVEDCAIEFELFGICDEYVSVGWVKEIIRLHMDDIPDTNVGGDNDTEEKIRVHIAECLHRIDNIRSFVGSKEHVSNDEKCIRNIEILKTSIAALEEYLRLKKKNGNDSWIPYTVQNMPKKEGLYLVTCDDEKYPVKRMRFKNGIWLWNYGIYDGKILAWQPLPEPYRPEEE